MKKIVFFFLMTILIASCHQEELSSVPDEPEGKQPVFDLSEEEVLQGCIYVKLKEEPAGGSYNKKEETSSLRLFLLSITTFFHCETYILLWKDAVAFCIKGLDHTAKTL